MSTRSAGTTARYVLDAWPLELVDTADPRKFMLRGGGWKVMALTSLSWLLPVELSPDGLRGRRDPLRQGDRAAAQLSNATASRMRGSAGSATAS